MGGGSTDIVATELSQDLVIPAYTDTELMVKKVEKGLPISELGCTKFAIDKFTLSSDEDISSSDYYKYEAKHSLDVIPKYALLYANNIGKSKSAYYVTQGAFFYGRGLLCFENLSGDISDYSGYMPITNTTVTIQGGNWGSKYLAGGVEYTLITMA